MKYVATTVSDPITTPLKDSVDVFHYFIDSSHTSEAFYRLNHTNPYGFRQYSKILSVVNDCEQNKEIQWVIYPIPAKEILNIKNLKNNTPTQIYIANSTGAIVYKSTMEGNVIQIGHLKNGYYYLHIQQENHSQVITFTVVK